MDEVLSRNNDKFTWKGGLGPYLGEELAIWPGFLSRIESLRALLYNSGSRQEMEAERNGVSLSM